MSQSPPMPQATQIIGLYARLMIAAAGHLCVLFAVWWVAYICVGLVEMHAIGRDSPQFGVASLSILVAPLMAGATAHRLLWAWQPGLGESLQVGLRAYTSLLGVFLLSRLAAMIGFAVLIIPAFAAIVLLSLAPVIMVAERPGIIAALSESARRITAAAGQVMFAYVVFLLILAAGAFTVSVLAAILSPLIGSVAVSAGASAFMSLAHVAFAVAVYLSLNGHETAMPWQG